MLKTEVLITHAKIEMCSIDFYEGRDRRCKGAGIIINPLYKIVNCRVLYCGCRKPTVVMVKKVILILLDEEQDSKDSKKEVAYAPFFVIFL